LTSNSRVKLERPSLKTVAREITEISVVITSAAAILATAAYVGPSIYSLLTWIVVFVAAGKTFYYFAETLLHLLHATANDLPYHQFLVLMAYNMAEVTISFAIDFFVLQQLDQQSFEGLSGTLSAPRLFFDCLYFSILNFSFFGYGDILPRSVPAKIVMLFEVVTEFTTVIFLISDFVSMKDSMRSK
jgi:hypothetical protein